MTTTFTGWLRLPGQDWQPIVTAETEDEAFRLLHDHIDRLAPPRVDAYYGPSSIDLRQWRRR